ncbi:hypothetical protein IDSA_02900 [Pseudidiomarina salinarum]|uniref:Multifunctional fusion protein n=1 Tax=Pseudidiomarina salinarum TaxID=435908 RepID=A0A094IVE6_9GAMM|nr:bifunctional indole-3-glycerol-phosphate synthase TrpC/phosphoribosylanthranilate isomerase TrpF [Pseudidiomarina salinarum]KFZ31655.1 hypothetical protein IDSA_02900 [Pseudidiomarina salinarum]RUO70574.1 bifunctional indole-3-glycerol-phosphate synthase TrpC/phosphoribosylanthranilate isomerase TrpF [Pseudidiomarina salinarum]
MAETILQQIVAHRRQAIAQLASRYDADELQSQLTPSQRSLAEALAKPRSSFILECKKASPSKGLIREDFHPVTMARTYARYADAISVLTEPDYFQGDFRYLAAVSAAVDIPVLCKDFIVEPLQVLLARHFGADAILLMLSVLDDEQYQSLSALAAEFNLDVLTEVSTPEEMARAKRLQAKIIGINNRNLHDLSIDNNRSIELSAQAPEGALLVAESGYTSHHQIRASAPYVDGFLIGSALSARPNIDQACRELIYGQHKVCGLTDPADAMVARAAGAAFGGLIFVERSPRFVDLEAARRICQAEPDLSFVGVFADQPVQQVIDYAHQLGLAAVQLHGHEDIDYVNELRKSLPAGCVTWKAIGVDEPLLLPPLEVEAFLLDNRYGGSGQTFDWTLLASLTGQQREQCILAGGLSADNASAALATGINRLDFNSGVEYQPGGKDAGLIIELFHQLRQYGRNTL